MREVIPSCKRCRAVALAIHPCSTPTPTGHQSFDLDPRRKLSTSLIVLSSNEQVLERSRGAGEISCADGGARVVAWGFARQRVVRTLGSSRTIAPRRVRCNSCKKTHVVLPAEVVVRRRDDAGVIEGALLRAANGARARENSRELGRSRETVRNWISRFCENALVAELIGTRTLVRFDAHAGAMRLVWRTTSLARALEALGLCVAAFVRLFGPLTPSTAPRSGERRHWRSSAQRRARSLSVSHTQ